ncbi:MAG: FKBP-type peptidyl-prolyl cis-trans isomerase, partial [Proteobacteria bacterium]|nr:FKBP-type peptidyl-prolyl cis-trans isomerase [Pseudomonadota bacterium]
DKISYTIGVATGINLKRQSIDVDPDIMARGLKDSLSGGKLLMSDQELQGLMTTLRKEMAVKQMVTMAEQNKKDGDAFLAENGKKEGVTTLASGLQYRVLREGKGRSPKPTDTVVVHYRGTLLNGTEFDSSYKRNEPASVDLDSVIKGWKEALPLMNEGAKWQLFIPPDLAYGENGNRSVEPNSTLLFEVELISVRKEAALPAPAKPGVKSSKPAARK